MSSRPPISKRLRLLIAAAILGALALVPAIADAGMTAPRNYYFVAGGTSQVYGMGLTGYADTTNVLVSLSTSVGTLKIEDTTGVNFSYGYSSSGSELLFWGQAGQLKKTLALSISLTTPQPTIKVTKPGVATTPVVIKGMATTYRADLTYFPKTQHFYKYVAIAKCAVDTDNGCTTDEQTARNPDTAKAAAEASTELGQTGYLASITSADENAFVAEKIEGATAVIIGGRDSDVEGTWKWIGGPDNGMQFWSGNCVAAGGAAYNGAFANWSTGEPNNYISSTNKCAGTAYDPSAAAGEDCTVTNWTDNSATETVGYWNDVPCGNNAYTARRVRGYVAEYGNKASGGDYTGVDLIEKTIQRQLPVTVPQPNLLQKVFNLLFVSKKATPLPKQPKKPATFSAKMKVQMNVAGTYVIYLKRPDGKGVPFEFQPGSKVAIGKGLFPKTTTLKKTEWTMQVKTAKDNETVTVTPILKTNDWAKPGGTRVFFSLIAPNKASKNQMCLANWCQSAPIPVPKRK